MPRWEQRVGSMFNAKVGTTNWNDRTIAVPRLALEFCNACRFSLVFIDRKRCSLIKAGFAYSGIMSKLPTDSTSCSEAGTRMRTESMGGLLVRCG